MNKIVNPTQTDVYCLLTIVTELIFFPKKNRP